MLDSRLVRLMPAVGNLYSGSPLVRQYHNWSHIVALFDLINQHSLMLDIHQYLAVLFHDIVYVPGSVTNEHDSSEVMRNMVDGQFTHKQLNDAAIIIHDTKTHTPSFFDSRIVLDLDMAILGQTEKHDFFNRAIRNEYRRFSDEDFNKGRSKFFQELLARPTIYYTKVFQDAYEQSARNYMRHWCESVK